MVTLMPVSSCFRTPFASKRVHVSQTLLEPALKNLDPTFPLIYEKLSWKISTLVRSEILGLFGNTLSTDHICSRHRWEKLQQQIETVLCQKERTFSEFLLEFANLQKIVLILKRKSSFRA